MPYNNECCAPPSPEPHEEDCEHERHSPRPGVGAEDGERALRLVRGQGCNGPSVVHFQYLHGRERRVIRFDSDGVRRRLAT